MRTHKGEHPRMGAMDVCPFIPVANVSMDECVAISKTFARLAADALGVPFFRFTRRQRPMIIVENCPRSGKGNTKGWPVA